MHLNHLAKCNQSNHRILRNEIDTLLQGVFQLDHVFAADDGVHDQDENGSGSSGRLGRRLLRLRQDVLKRGLLGHQLEGETRLADIVGVVWREIVFGDTNGAHPRLVPEVELAEGIQNIFALLALNWCVLNRHAVLYLFQWSVHAAERDSQARLVDLRLGPVVPREPEAVLNFSLLKVHFLR